MLRVGGVPEHFNLPWKLHGHGFTWKDFPGGTGAMAEALKNDEIDVALMLTEGAVKAIENGLEARIVSQYVRSPLIWGIHMGKDYHPFENQPPVFAISRFGSGSHLMAYVWAEEKGVGLTEKNFVVVKDLSGALETLQKEPVFFLWEKFTTSPYVERGLLHRILDVPTPWPCFVVVARNQVYLDHQQELINLLEKVGLISQELMENREALAQRVAADYSISDRNAAIWAREIDWQVRPGIDLDMLEKVRTYLRRLKLI